MEEARSAPRWRFLISPRWLAWHAFAVVAFWGMCWLGDWQLHRALAGNGLSWAYTFEWPLFALMGAYFWAKTIRDEFHLRSGAVSEAADGRPRAALSREAAAGEAPPVAAASAGGRAALAGQVPGRAAESGDRDAAAREAYLARLSQEVRDHGRWHGLR